MGDALERGIVMMDPQAYRELINSKFNNIAAVPNIDSDMLRYLFTKDELTWLRNARHSISP